MTNISAGFSLVRSFVPFDDYWAVSHTFGLKRKILFEGLKAGPITYRTFRLLNIRLKNKTYVRRTLLKSLKRYTLYC